MRLSLSFFRPSSSKQLVGGRFAEVPANCESGLARRLNVGKVLAITEPNVVAFVLAMFYSLARHRRSTKTTRKSGLLRLAPQESGNVEIVGRNVLCDVANILLNLVDNRWLLVGG